jgi:hypothetical protein
VRRGNGNARFIAVQRRDHARYFDVARNAFAVQDLREPPYKLYRAAIDADPAQYRGSRWNFDDSAAAV